jgi:RTX calcium-binding nonapeptide repeat (4 copies)
MFRWKRVVLLTVLAVALAPSTALAYGWNVVGITVQSSDDGTVQLVFTGDDTDNHLSLMRTGPATLRATVAAGEGIGLGDPSWPEYAGNRCTRVGGDDATVDCSLEGVASPKNGNQYQPSAAIRVDLRGGAADRFEVTGTGLGVVTSATSTANTTALIGGDETDLFAGGSGTDLLEGGGGDDYLAANDDGGDILRGGEGEDDLQGRWGTNLLDGGPGNDVVRVRREAYGDYVDPLSPAHPNSTCGPGDDLIWGLLAGETALPSCERRSGATTTAPITPSGTAPVGRTLSVSPTTAGSPLQRADVDWRRCPPLPTSQWDCPIVGTGTSYTVTEDDLGFSLLAEGVAGWIGLRSRTVGFWFRHRIAVDPKPPAITPVIGQPGTRVPTSTTAPAPAEASPDELARRLLSLFIGGTSTVSTGTRTVTAKLPLTIGAPLGSRGRVSIYSVPTRTGGKPVLLGTGEVVLATSTREVVIRLTASGRKAVARRKKQRVDVKATLAAPGAAQGSAAARATLRRR